jgi:hypothetical protein
MSKVELIKILEELLGSLPTIVLKQITKFRQQGITYKEIARAASYWFDVLGRDKNTINTYGIGIVPNILPEANQYYNNLKQQQERRKNQFLNKEDVEIREVSPQRRIIRKEEIKIDEL